MILNNFFNRTRTASLPSDHSVLTSSDKKELASLLWDAGKEGINWKEIDRAVTVWGDVAITVYLTSGRTIYLTSRSFWTESETVKSIRDMIAVCQAANAKEQGRVAARQVACRIAMEEAITHRRKQAVAV
jgi:hypothetical protein